MERVIVVGSGLVGSMIASLLAQRGYDVAVYEKRPDMRRASIAAGKSINLIATSRGIAALQRVGLGDQLERLSARVDGRTMHSLAGELSFHPYGKNSTEFNHSVSRGELNKVLMTHAEQHGVKIHFEHELIAGDLAAGRLTFKDASGVQVHEQADRIIGADGAFSIVRTLLTEQSSAKAVFTDLGHGYKELEIPATESGAFAIDGHSLHIWPRGRLMLMALPNVDRSFTVTLYLPQSGENSFESIDSKESARALFEQYFADSIPLIKNLEKSYQENPVGVLGVLRCDNWVLGDRVALLGDAAHAIVPFFGQGMNCGFEDCTVLMDLLEKFDGDFAQIFPAYHQARKPNGDAVAQLSLDNFVVMCERVGDERFLLCKQVEHRLENEIPELYRSCYSMVCYSLIPYTVALQVGKIQESILEELTLSLTGPEQLDLERAKTLIAERLTPLLVKYGVELNY